MDENVLKLAREIQKSIKPIEVSASNTVKVITRGDGCTIKAVDRNIEIVKE